MLLFKHSYSFLFLIFTTAFLFSNIITLPVENNLYDKFIHYLEKNKCTLPEKIILPFSPLSDQSHFSYLSDPLKECQTSNADMETENEEAKFLCNEIFDAFGNITCTVYSTPLPTINVPLSEDICDDFKTMKNIFPKDEEYLSRKLADSVLCKVICSRKYEQLCKTLLWSYGVQDKIKSFKNSEKLNEKGGMNKTKIGTTSTKANFENGAQNSDRQSSMELTDKKISTVAEVTKTPQVVTDLNEKKPLVVESLINPGQTTSNKTTIVMNAVNATSMKSTITPDDSKVSATPKNEPKPSVDGVSLVESSQTPPTKDEQNEVHADANANNIKGVTTIPSDNKPNTNSLTEISTTTDTSRKYPPLSSLPDKENTSVPPGKENGDGNSESNNFVPHDIEEDNELNNVDIEDDEKQMKDKPTNVGIGDKDKEMEKPPLTDFETSLGSSDVNFKQSQPTISPVLPDRDEDVEHQEDKEQEQYNDTENDGDYPKSEYENSFNPPAKNKESSSKSSVAESSNQNYNSYDTFLSSKVRNNIGRMPDDIQMIPSFPEQEDSHFFFYFLSVVLILMAGYLIFHNKQKIIALIVEGRHERRRRSHGAAYKKLETK